MQSEAGNASGLLNLSLGLLNPVTIFRQRGGGGQGSEERIYDSGLSDHLVQVTHDLRRKEL